MCPLTRSQQGISSIEPGRRLGVAQNTAWMAERKLAQVMLERDAAKPLTGRAEIDGACRGGEHSGGKRGRGAPGRRPFAAALETTPDGQPVRLKLGRVVSFRSASIAGFAQRSLDPACTVAGAGLQCFGSATGAGCTRQAIETGSGPAAARVPAFEGVNTAPGTIKTAVTGTCCAISSKHVPRCLAEFECRFTRRHDLAAMIPRLCWAGARTAPMPRQLLKLAEVYA